ncbi:Hypothetical protein NTJ_11139 [Nesidiocoris tenuis]|uniref:Uncharacterized protein n=1 Tax=Nesidiocoris tenuis TaxID=355587 RepID=A0ABN7B1M7_9HEMI|nr:Hypothetical protein NTJ_11139 [Nesidiocoris tenuis]
MGYQPVSGPPGLAGPLADVTDRWASDVMQDSGSPYFIPDSLLQTPRSHVDASSCPRFSVNSSLKFSQYVACLSVET